MATPEFVPVGASGFRLLSPAKPGLRSVVDQQSVNMRPVGGDEGWAAPPGESVNDNCRRFGVTSSEAPRGGVPASGSGSPIADLLAPDFDDEPRSVHLVLLDEALAYGRRCGPAKTTQEIWVEDNGLVGGHWEKV